jgi:hypothetical protein
VDIGCLGWGSLIWDSRGMPVRGTWFDDGPLLPVEFARESGQRRITLVICNVPYRVRVCWVLMDAEDLQTAKRYLAAREGVEEKNIERSIGFWVADSGKSHGDRSDVIGEWARTKGLDAVVWTNLQAGFKNKRGTLPSADEIIDHLRGLQHSEGKLAEEYVRRTPPQIDTDYRRRIEREFGWFHQA